MAEVDYFQQERERQNRLFALQLSPYSKLNGDRLYDKLFGRKLTEEELSWDEETREVMDAALPEHMLEKIKTMRKQAEEWRADSNH